MIITANARKKLVELNFEKKLLRIGIVSGGCSGMSYKMEWINSDQSSEEKDHLYLEESSLVVVIDKKSALFLKDVELNYSEELNNVGFQWNNPSAKRVCGCGESFS